MRFLDQDAGAVTGARIGAAGSAVAKVDEDLYPLIDNRVRAFAIDVCNQADPTGVVLCGRIVQTFLAHSRKIRKAIWLAHLSHSCIHPET